MLAWVWAKGGPYTLSGAIYAIVATLELSLEGSQKAKNKTTALN